MKKISSRAFTTEVINELSDVLYDQKVKFDSNPFLLQFDFKVYDLQKGILSNYKPTDYMTMSVGYDIDRKNRDIKKEELMNLIKDITGDQVSFVLKILAITLFGKGFETFTIL